jgi:hypothetical protein
MYSSNKESAWPIIVAGLAIIFAFAAPSFGPNEDLPDSSDNQVTTKIPGRLPSLADEIKALAKLPESSPSVAGYCAKAPEGQTPCP